MEMLLEREWFPKKSNSNTSQSADADHAADAGKNVGEVLDITEAAIRALNKPTQANSTFGTSNASETSALKAHRSVLSPMDWHLTTGSGTDAVTQSVGSMETSGVRSNCQTDNTNIYDDRRHSVDSKSSTASDVLKRTTSVDHDISLSSTTQVNIRSLGDQSIVSTASDTKSNISNSGFLTGNLKKVKVSSKRLKEVDSPFDESILAQNISKFAGEDLPESLVKRNLSEVKKHKKEKKKKLKSGTGEIHVYCTNTDINSGSFKKVKATATPPPTPQQRSRVPPYEFNGLFSPLSSVEHARNEDHVSDIHDHSVSVERHIPVDVVVHLTSPSESSVNSDLNFRTTEKQGVRNLSGSPSVDQEKWTPVIKNMQNEPGRVEHCRSPKKSPKEKIVTVDRRDKCSDTEIITVPETIVTVQARDGNLSQASASSLNSESVEIPQKEPTNMSSKENNQQVPDLQVSQHKVWAQKSHGRRGLFQGDAVEGSDPSQVRNSEDTVITQFNLTEKQKNLKSNIAKSRQVSVPVKRVVQPRIVHQGKGEEKSNSDSAAERGTSADAITTAAVAASAAVAATQPFLQAQKDVELKMAQILERLAAFQVQPGHAQTLTSTGDSGVGLESLKSNGKVSQLEKQVENLTLKRLDHIEKMQQQYMNVQAQLLGISRNRPGEPPSGNVNHVRSSPSKGKYRSVTMEKDPKPKKIENEKILDTPAPRRTAPTPVVYEAPPSKETKLDYDTPVKRTKSRGLLETILAETQSPAYTKTPPTARDENASRDQDPSDLVHDLEDLKTRMKKVLNEVETVNTGLRNKHSSQDPEMGASPSRPRDAPLDAYLLIKDPEGLSSPYPVIERDHGNAPVRDNFRDAQEVLQYVRQSRHLLEANLQAILRKRNDADVFTLLEQLSPDSMMAEKYNIRKKVDQQISSMKSDLEKEIFDELLKIEETKEKSFMIPERDINRNKVPAGRGRVAARGISKPRGGVSSRVDSGLRRPTAKSAAAELKKAKDAAGPSTVRPAVKPFTKPKVHEKPYETEEYMTRIYGKADYQNQRSMHKSAPYLHYQTVAKPKAPRPPAKVVSPDSKSKHRPEHYYFSAGNLPTEGGVAPAQGQLIRMAVPLGKPRQEHTGPPPSALVTSTPQATSTPLIQTPQRVTIINIQDQEDDDREISRNTDAKSRKPNLSFQTLPQVNIDVAVLDAVIAPASPATPVHPIRKNSDGTENDQEAHEDDNDKTARPSEDLDKTPVQTEINDTVENGNAEAEEVIDLPGFQPKIGTYHGPTFPPRAPPITQPPPSSDVLAGDIHRRELLQTHATQWLEQELMARVLSDIASRQSQQPTSVQETLSQQQRDKDASESAVVEAIGEAGFQMFVEVGMDVDNDLVRSLVQQVILEKIQTALAQRNQERPSTPPHSGSRQSPVPKPRNRSPTTPRQKWEPQREARSPIPTPEPTPVGSIHEESDNDESVVYTPDPSMSLSSEKEPPVEDRVQDKHDASEDDIPPVLENDDRRTAATPPNFTPRMEHDVDTPEPSLKDLPPQPTGVDVGIGTDPSREATQPPWGTDQPFWNMGGPGSPFVPVLLPTGPSLNQLLNQLQGGQDGETPPQPPASTSTAADPKTRGPSKQKKPKLPATPPIMSESESEVSEAAPPPWHGPKPVRGAETAENDVKPPKVVMVDRPTSPASNISQESVPSDTMNYLSEGQWLISARSEGEMRNNYPVNMSFSQLLGDDTFHDTEELDPDEISEGEIIQRLQNMQNPLVVMANQLNRRPLSFIERQFRYTQSVVPSRSIGEVNPQVISAQARTMPAVLRVQEQQSTDNDHSPGEIPNMPQPSLVSQPRPSTSRGNTPREPLQNHSGAPDRSSNAQGRPGPSRLQDNILGRQNQPSGLGGPLRLADMRKRGGIGAGPIMSTTDRPARSQGGRRSRSASLDFVVDSRDTLAGTISGGTFSNDSREFLGTNESFQSTGRSLNILDLNTDNFGEISGRDLQTPDQMNLDEILHSPEYLGRTFSQSELESTGRQSRSGLTQSFIWSRLRDTPQESEQVLNEADLGTSGRHTGRYVDSLESSMNLDQLVQRQPHSINSTQDGFNWLVGAQGAQGGQSGRSLMATVNLESTTSAEDASDGRQNAPRSLSVKMPVLGQQESGSEDSIEDVSDL